MSLRRLIEVIAEIEKENKKDEANILFAIKSHNGLLAIYQTRCNIRDEILDLLKKVDEL